jgi:hypothetical protein
MLLAATTSKDHPRTILKRELCALVGMQPMNKRVEQVVDGVKTVTVVPGTKYQVTMDTGVEILHLLEQAGVVKGMPRECPRPLGPRPRDNRAADKDPSAHDAGDRAMWAAYRKSVARWSASVLEWLGGASKRLSGLAVEQIANYLRDPLGQAVVYCPCALCVDVAAAAAAAAAAAPSGGSGGGGGGGGSSIGSPGGSTVAVSVGVPSCPSFLARVSALVCVRRPSSFPACFLLPQFHPRLGDPARWAALREDDKQDGLDCLCLPGTEVGAVGSSPSLAHVTPTRHTHAL